MALGVFLQTWIAYGNDPSNLNPFTEEITSEAKPWWASRVALLVPIGKYFNSNSTPREGYPLKEAHLVQISLVSDGC